MLEAFIPAQLFAFFMVVLRIGAALMQFPGIGDAYVNPRARMSLALLVAFVVTPVVQDTLPPRPVEPASLVVLALAEIFIGLLLGTAARMILAALMIAGMIMAFMSTLSNALVNTPSAQQQGSVVGAFLGTVGVLIIFASGAHEMLLHGMVQSYSVFPPGEPLPMNDIANFVARLMADVFKLGFQVSMPFLVVGTIFYLGVGLINRLMPQVQIFFVAIPIQVGKGLVLLLVGMPIIMQWFIQNYFELYRPLLNL